MMRRLPSVATALCGAITLAMARPGVAHVTIDPDKAEAGSIATIRFVVPNERDNDSTVKLEVQLPPEHRFASVTVKPTPGWTHSEVASVITWSAGEINPGGFQHFEIVVGPLPTSVASLTFKAVQTYKSGDVVRWIEIEGPDKTKPEHPAPVLALVTSSPPSLAAAIAALLAAVAVIVAAFRARPPATA